MQRGQAEWAVEGQREWVTPGSLFYTLPWQEHGDVDERDQGLELYFIILPLDKNYKRAQKSWRFHPALNLGLNQRDERDLCTAFMGLPQHSCVANNAVQYFMREIVTRLDDPGYLHNAYLSSLLTSLLIQSMCSYRSADVQEQNDGEQRVAHFLQILAAQCHEKWSLATMAARCDLERSQFSVYVQRLAGLTPVQLLNNLRVQRAKELLAHTSQSVTGIAFDCGFESSQYFARVFKQVVGCDARSYRAQFDS